MEVGAERREIECQIKRQNGKGDPSGQNSPSRLQSRNTAACHSEDPWKISVPVTQDWKSSGVSQMGKQLTRKFPSAAGAQQRARPRSPALVLTPPPRCALSSATQREEQKPLVWAGCPREASSVNLQGPTLQTKRVVVMEESLIVLSL